MSAGRLGDGALSARQTRYKGCLRVMGTALTPQSLVLDGRFRILEPLGGGGMGEVYLAEQVSLGRKVALKVLRQDLSLQPGMVDRFKREARLLSSVDHPAVVRVIDFGQTQSATCLVMELAQGQTLRQALESGPIEPSRARALLLQLAEGLAAIHEKGIIHRDLKPDNVILCQTTRGEQARLLDFGIARLAEPEASESNLSQVGLVIGTPEYLSPEQAMGAAVEPRSDLYSFGVLAFRMLSGVLPFPGPLPRQFLAQHVNMAPRELLEVAPQTADEPQLASLVMACLQKELTTRPASAAWVVDVLAGRQAISTPPPDAASDTWLRPGAGVTRSDRPATKDAALPSVSVLLERGRELQRRALSTLSPRVRKRVLPWGAAAVVIVGAAFLLIPPSTAAQVKSLIEEGRPKEALNLLDSESRAHQGKLPTQLIGFKAAALHKQGEHSDEGELLSSVRPSEVEQLDAMALHGLAEDYAREPDRAQGVLEKFPKEWVESQLSKLAKEDFSTRSWGALRYLESVGGTRRLDLVSVYIDALKSKNCYVRGIAAKRLGELRDSAANGALRELEQSQRPKNLGIFTGSCGHDEASAALKAIAEEP